MPADATTPYDRAVASDAAARAEREAVYGDDETGPERERLFARLSRLAADQGATASRDKRPMSAVELDVLAYLAMRFWVSEYAVSQSPAWYVAGAMYALAGDAARDIRYPRTA